jgi:hypothetical protein
VRDYAQPKSLNAKDAEGAENLLLLKVFLCDLCVLCSENGAWKTFEAFEPWRLTAA